MGELSEYIRAMVRRSPPEGVSVVPRSTPVVAFGDPRHATIATLGINPSRNEFVVADRLLTGVERRLATLDSLGAQRLDALTDEQVAAVVEDCATYFHRRPYRLWFDPLDKLLRVGAGASYYDGSACHLDLVQWATDPIWGRIPDSGIRQVLLDDGVPHLRAQLARENIRLVLLNGRRVLEQVRKVGFVDLEEVGYLSGGQGQCQLYVGTAGRIRWVGWSTNLQSSWGVSATFKQALGAWLATVSEPSADTRPVLPVPASEEMAGDYLPPGLRVKGKTELNIVLSRWLARSGARTIGDVADYGGRPWLFITLGIHEVALNADTKRDAVETFVKASSQQPERPWRVIPNRNGRINKVLPGPDPAPLPGWYAYLTRPLLREALI